VVVEIETREVVSPPASEGEVRVEEKVDISEQLEALEVAEKDVAEDTAPVEMLSADSEEHVSPPVQTAPSVPLLAVEEDEPSTGEKPKVSYASIVSYCWVCSSCITNHEAHVQIGSFWLRTLIMSLLCVVLHIATVEECRGCSSTRISCCAQSFTTCSRSFSWFSSPCIFIDSCCRRYTQHP
jgi:hypothetical protein